MLRKLDKSNKIIEKKIHNVKDPVILQKKGLQKNPSSLFTLRDVPLSASFNVSTLRKPTTGSADKSFVGRRRSIVQSRDSSFVISHSAVTLNEESENDTQGQDQLLKAAEAKESNFLGPSITLQVILLY